MIYIEYNTLLSNNLEISKLNKNFYRLDIILSMPTLN